MRVLLACAALFALSCSRQHSSPEVGDSVTNWLHACSRDSECHGGTQCLDSVCSVTCSNAPDETCSLLSGRATCDTSALICDLRCDDSSVCGAISPSLSCRQGRCREGAQRSALTPIGADASAPTIPQPIMDSLPLNTSAPVSETFDTASAFKLSEGTPSDVALAWSGNRWDAFWFTGLEPDMTTRPMTVARIYPDGQFDKRTSSLSDVTVSFTFTSANGDGRFALLSGGSDKHTCLLRVIDLTFDVQSIPAQLPCDHGFGSQQVSPIPHRDEWLVAWHTMSNASDSVSIARYDPGSSDWSVGPWQFKSGSSELPGIAAGEGGSVWLWSPVSSAGGAGLDIRRLDELTQPREVYEAFVPSMIVPYALTARVNRIIPTVSGALVIAAQDDAMTATRLRNDGMSSVSIPLPGVPAQDVDMNALYIPDQRRVVLCIAGKDLQLRILDEQGFQLMSPVVIDADRDHSACQLAWSGSDLLVAWTTSLYDETNFPISWDTWARVVPAALITP